MRKPLRLAAWRLLFSDLFFRKKVCIISPFKRKNMKNFTAEVHEKEPAGFVSKVQVAACYLEVEGKLLLLQRAQEKFEPGKWGVPAGKLESGETPEEGAKRELFEETGISIKHQEQIRYLNTLYIRKPEVDYTYHMFKIQLAELPAIHLSDEHLGYTWASLKEIETIPLMDGAKEALCHYKAALPKKRAGASVNAYLILKKDNKVLLHLRQNTGYCDGMWSLVAGHVEDGEPATAAMIREAQEEIGIQLEPSQLKVVHVLHRQTNRLNVDIFFSCSGWQGDIRNCEPEKCEKLEFFSEEALPSNIVEYNRAVLKAVLNGEFYSEEGWE